MNMNNGIECPNVTSLTVKGLGKGEVHERAMIGPRRIVLALPRGQRRTLARFDLIGGHRRDLIPRSKPRVPDRKSTRLNSSHITISYAVFCLKKKIKTKYMI